GTNVKTGTEVDDLDAGQPEKLGAREVGKLITAAASRAELQKIHREHGDVFTEAMQARYDKLMAEQFPETDHEPQDDVDEQVAQEEIKAVMPEPSVEANKALGAATTVEELQAVWKQYAKVMTDEQKEFAKSQAEKLKAIEAEHAAKAPAPGNETQVAMPDWVLENEEETDEVEPYSIEDAHARGKACKNLGELRELFKEFHRQIQAGKADPDTLAAIGEYSAGLK